MLFLNLIIALLLIGFGFFTGLFVYWCLEARIDRVNYNDYLKKVKDLLKKEGYDPTQPPTVDDFDEKENRKDEENDKFD